MTRFTVAIGLFFCPLALLISCAPTKDPFGLALRQGHIPSSAAPESLTVDLGISFPRKDTPPISARLYIQPDRLYRMDVFGFPSGIAASYLWTGGHWTLLLNDKRQIWQGEGDTLDIEGLALRLPSVNAMLGFLWGDPLPEFRNRSTDTLAWIGDTLRWRAQGIRWQARFDSTRGICLEVQSAGLVLQYRKYQRYNGRVLPGEVEVIGDSGPLLLMRLNLIKDHPVWKKDPFSINIPEGYELHRVGL